MKDNFDLKKFLTENKTFENFNPYTSEKESLNESDLKAKIREMILAELGNPDYSDYDELEDVYDDEDNYYGHMGDLEDSSIEDDNLDEAKKKKDEEEAPEEEVDVEATAEEEPATEEAPAEEAPAEEPVAEGALNKTNETLRGLTGRQMQNLMRIIRKHQNGELSKLQALVLIRGGYGISDEDAAALLNTPETKEIPI